MSTMNRVLKILSVSFTLLLAAFVLMVASFQVRHPVLGSAPRSEPPTLSSPSSGEPPSNEIRDIQQLD
jgi:hypothetical protein